MTVVIVGSSMSPEHMAALMACRAVAVVAVSVEDVERFFPPPEPEKITLKLQDFARTVPIAITEETFSGGGNWRDKQILPFYANAPRRKHRRGRRTG